MAISDKITSMTNHLTADYDAIESVVGEVTVDKNIENIAPLINNLYEELPKVTASGTELTINDTRAGKMKVQPMGNTSQTQKTGKNLLSLPFSSSSQFGITVTKNSDGTLTVNGTATADAAVIFNTSVTLPAGTYTLSGCPSGGSVNTYNLNLDQLSTMRDNGSGVTFTLNAERTSTAYVSVKSGVTLNNVIFKPMIVSGSTSGDFEPYIGKKATPNPDNPEQVHTCSGDNEVVVTGKNIFDGLWTSPGVSTNFIPVKANQSYKYSENGVAEGMNYRFYETKTGNYEQTYVSNTSSFTPTKDGYVILYRTTHSESGCQLELGTTATPYEPYQSSTYPINLPVENILNNTATSTTLANVIITVNPDKSITLNGTANAGGNLKVGEVNFESGETYTISGVTGFTDSTLQLYTASTTAFPTGSRLQSYNGAVTRTAQATENCDIKLYVYSGVTYNNVTIYPQIEKGTKANHYTPYGTTPIELCKIGTYQDKFIRNSGKNLFDNNFNNLAFWNTTIGNTTAFAEGNQYLGAYCKVEAGKTYSISRTKLTSRFAIAVGNEVPTASSTGLVVAIDNSAYKIENITIPSGYSYLYLYLSNSSETSTGISIMINEGTTALPYEPYGNGEWYLEKHIGKEVFTGANTENWTKYTSTDSQGNTYGFNTSLSNTPLQVTNLSNFALCNYFTQNNRNAVSVIDTQGIYLGSGTALFLKITQSLVSGGTVENLNTWLSTHNTSVYYVLNTPTYTKIEGTLKDELDAVWRAYSYNEQTNISQVNNDLPFELSITALEG